MLRFTRLPRPVDFRFHSNRWAAAIAGAAALIVFGLEAGTEGFGPAARAAFSAAVGSFLVWALAREIDPDRSVSATIAAVASVPVIILLGSPSLILLLVVLMTARLLVRSVGHAPTGLDIVGLTALGVFAGTIEGGWMPALVLAFAVARDRTLPGDPVPFGRIAAYAIAAGATGLAVIGGVGTWSAPSAPEALVAGVGFVAAVTTRIYQPTSTGDLDHQPLPRRRLASARRVTAAGLVLAALVSGSSGIQTVAPAWAAFLGVAIVGWDLLPHRHGEPSR